MVLHNETRTAFHPFDPEEPISAAAAATCRISSTEHLLIRLVSPFHVPASRLPSPEACAAFCPHTCKCCHVGNIECGVEIGGFEPTKILLEGERLFTPVSPC